MRKFDLKLDKYGISRYAYRELLNVCLQYPDKKLQFEGMYGPRAVKLTGMPGGGDVSDPTAQTAIRTERLRDDVEAIEAAAKEADEAIAPYILRNVTTGMSWERMDVPCGINQFYTLRRKFFYILAAKKGML